MKRIGILVLIGIQLCALMSFGSVVLAYNSTTDKTQLSAGTDDAQDVLINALIDVMAGAYNPSSPYYDKAFAQATKSDLYQLFLSTRRLVQHEDFEQLIVGLDKVMALNNDPDPHKNILAKFLKQVLKGMAPLNDAETLKGMLVRLASIDKSLFPGSTGIIAGLSMMTENNFYGQKCTKADIDTSALRSMLFMISCADFISTLDVNGKSTGIHVLALLESSDHPEQEPGTVRARTHNVAEWFIGEIVTAIRWGREGKIKQGGRFVHMNAFQAYDWLMFKKRYQLSGVGYAPLKFEGVIGMVSHPLVQSILPAPVVEAFPALIELGGGMSETEYHGGKYDGFTSTSWRNRYGTAGKRHKLLVLFTPIMEYFWDAKDAQGRSRVNDLIHLLASLNEIPSAGYKSLDSGTDATFRNDNRMAGKSVLKTVEDSGVMTAALRPHGKDDTGLAPPALDLFVRVVAKMNAPKSAPADYRRLNSAFPGDTLLDAVFAEINIVNAKIAHMSANAKTDPIDRSIEAIFVPLKGQTNSIVTKFEAGVHVAAQTTKDKQFMAAFKTDLFNLVDAAEKMIMSADLERIYTGLDMILALNDNPDPQQNTLAKFLNNAIRGMAPISDGDSIKGLLIALADVDTKSLQNTANLNDDLIMVLTSNMYGQKISTAEVKTCALRALLFMIKVADQEQHLELAGIDTGIPLLSMMDSPDHPANEPGTVKDQTTNIAQWAIGEIVTAIRWGREGKFKIDGKQAVLNQFEAYDWLMYKKHYSLKFAGIKLMTFEGMAGMLSNRLVQLFIPAGITDAFPALVELGGGMTNAEYAGGKYSGFTDTSWQGRYGTAGKRHKLLAFVASLMEFSWNGKDAQGRQRSGDLISVLTGLNEIPVPPAYERLKKGSNDNPNATLRLDNQKAVLKTVQDSNILVYLVQARGEHDIMVPALNLLKRVVAKLNQKDSGLEYKRNHPGFKGNTLIDALFTEMNIKGYKAQSGDGKDLIEQSITALFTPPAGESKNAVAKMQHYIHRIIGSIYASPKRAQSTPVMRRTV